MKLGRPETNRDLSREILGQKGSYSMSMREFLRHADNIQRPREKRRFWEKLPLLGKLKRR